MVLSSFSSLKSILTIPPAGLAVACLLALASFSAGEDSPARGEKQSPRPSDAASDSPEGVADVAFVPSYNLTFVERDGKPLKADVYVPRGEGPFPAIMLVHGGAWAAGSKSNCFWHAKYFAERGYTAVAISYRLAPQAKFPAQIEDCRAALRWMRREADKFKIDPARIGGYGYSAGGHLVSLLATAEADADWPRDEVAKDAPSARLQAVAAGGAPVDFTALPVKSDFLAYFLGGTRAQMPDRYRIASPLTHVTRDDPPFFFFHGENDLLVPKEGIERMSAKLKDAGVESEIQIIGKVEHIGAFLSPRALGLTADFFDRTLKAKK